MLILALPPSSSFRTPPGTSHLSYFAEVLGVETSLIDLSREFHRFLLSEEILLRSMTVLEGRDTCAYSDPTSIAIERMIRKLGKTLIGKVQIWRSGSDHSSDRRSQRNLEALCYGLISFAHGIHYNHGSIDVPSLEEEWSLFDEFIQSKLTGIATCGEPMLTVVSSLPQAHYLNRVLTRLPEVHNGLTIVSQSGAVRRLLSKLDRCLNAKQVGDLTALTQVLQSHARGETQEAKFSRTQNLMPKLNSSHDFAEVLLRWQGFIEAPPPDAPKNKLPVKISRTFRGVLDQILCGGQIQQILFSGGQILHATALQIAERLSQQSRVTWAAYVPLSELKKFTPETVNALRASGCGCIKFCLFSNQSEELCLSDILNVSDSLNSGGILCDFMFHFGRPYSKTLLEKLSSSDVPIFNEYSNIHFLPFVSGLSDRSLKSALNNTDRLGMIAALYRAANRMSVSHEIADLSIVSKSRIPNEDCDNLREIIKQTEIPAVGMPLQWSSDLEFVDIGDLELDETTVPMTVIISLRDFRISLVSSSFIQRVNSGLGVSTSDVDDNLMGPAVRELLFKEFLVGAQ